MSTFHLVFRVVPTSHNEYVSEVEGALASCCVRADDPVSAITLAAFKVRQLDWDIVGIGEQPAAVTIDECRDKEMALEQYQAAQTQGISVAFTALSRDGKTCAGPLQLKKSTDFVLGDYLSRIAELKQVGRCLHFEAGIRCTEPIDAHSIQKSRVLSLIAQNGHVYVPSRNFSDTKRSLGGVVFAKQRINAASTFRGFCGKHDNELFEPIDNFPLASSSEQITLYAYRSLCREVFVKENAVLLFRELTSQPSRNQANQDIFNAVLEGSILALENLNTHKAKYEVLLKSNSFDSMKSVLFHCQHRPSIAFSGLLFPDFDFLGHPLQDLGNKNQKRDLVTFSFAPMRDGWGCLFAWHDDSSGSCVPLMRSLATKIYEGDTLGDYLFRFVLSNCENLALNPIWWESLSESQRAEIERLARCGTNVFSPLNPDYLATGFEGLSQWEFDYVISNFDP